MKLSRIGLIVVVLLPCLSCSTPSSPSVPASPTGLGEAHGQLIERYSPAGIPNGRVFIMDGLDRGRYATTDTEGRFVLSGLHQKQFSVWAGADGFVAAYLEVGVQDLSRLTLAPAVTDYRWSGTFPEPALDSFTERIVPFTAGHRGPVTVAFTAGCSTQSTYEPLGIQIYRTAEPDILLMNTRFGSHTARESSEERVLAADKYAARFTFWNQNRAGCPWSMAIRYPK